MGRKDLITRRNFAKLGAAGAIVGPALVLGHGAASAITNSKTNISSSTHEPQSSGPATTDDKLQSEFLFDLVFDRGAASKVGDRVVVPVSSGTFEGPKLKGTIGSPSGDWIIALSGTDLVSLIFECYWKPMTRRRFT